MREVAGWVGGRDAAGQRGGVGAGALGAIVGEAEWCAWGERLGEREDKGSSAHKEVVGAHQGSSAPREISAAVP
jgi:hypothetical protein